MKSKEGIERQYNVTLVGVDGDRQVEVDNLGNERRVLDSTPFPRCCSERPSAAGGILHGFRRPDFR